MTSNVKVGQVGSQWGYHMGWTFFLSPRPRRQGTLNMHMDARTGERFGKHPAHKMHARMVVVEAVLLYFR